MAIRPLTRVRYEIADPEGRRMSVDRLAQPERNVARAIQSLLRDSYAAYFEDGYEVLPKGTVVRTYNPNSGTKNRDQLTEMSGRMATGGQYWYVRDPKRMNELLGLAVLSPHQNGVEIDDLHIHPDYQGRDYGRVIACTALKYSGIEGALRLSHYADDPTANLWYRKEWGLQPRPDLMDPSGIKLGGHELPQIPYLSPDGRTVADVVCSLEACDPRLTEGIVVASGNR